MTNLIVDFAFSTLGLAEVNLGVLSENKAAIRVYEKCGFVVDRIDSKSMNHGGVLYDQVYMRKIRSMKSKSETIRKFKILKFDHLDLFHFDIRISCFHSVLMK